jgi:hypothetical protein
MTAVDPVSVACDAVEARLRSFFKPEKWEFAVVPDPMSIEEFKAVARKTPLLALGWRSVNPSSKSNGRRCQYEVALRLTVVVKHPLDAAKRFKGDRAGPGLFPAAMAAILLLNGHSVPDLGTFFATATAQAYAEGYGDHNIAIATIDLSILVTLGDLTGELEAAPEFLRMLSAFEPWPDGQERDGAYPVRQP